MKNIKLLLTIFTISLLQLVNAQQFPNDIQYQSIAPPITPAFPNYGGSVVDNSVSNSIEITRVTDIVNYEDGNGDPQVWYPTHEYAKIQVWNADQTKYKIKSWKVYDASNYQEIHELNNMFPSYWSNTNPDLIWSFRENGDIKKHVVSTNNTQTVATITKPDGSAYLHVMLGPGEGNFDKNDKYVALACKDGQDMDVVVFDLENLQVVTRRKFVGCWGDGTRDFPDFVDWVSVSQSGNYVVIMFHNALGNTNYYVDQDGINHYGVEVYNAMDMVSLSRIVEYGNHGDLGYAIDGDEVLVQFWGAQPGSVYMYKLDGSGSSRIAQHPDFGLYGHISCRNINRPGWAYVTNSRAQESGQLVAVKLDDTNTVEHFGHHFSSAQSYEQASMAVASPNGDKVCFKSDFGTSPDNGDVTYSFFANVATPLSIQDEYLKNVSIYPNPANDFVKINSVKDIKDITIYNAMGQKIKTFLVKNSNTSTINTTNLNNGFYYLKITTEKGEIIKQIIIQ